MKREMTLLPPTFLTFRQDTQFQTAPIPRVGGFQGNITVSGEYSQKLNIWGGVGQFLLFKVLVIRGVLLPFELAC